MTDDYRDLRLALAEALSSIPDCQVSAYVLSSPVLPTLWVKPGEVGWHRAMGNGHADKLMTIEALAALNTDQGSQELLDRMIADTGTYSVKAAIEADTTLGGVCDDATVTRTYDYGERLTPDLQTLVMSCKWDVEIMG